MYAVYMYVYEEEVIYVGKTNTSLQSRVWAHEKEPIFARYVDNCEIYYAELLNATETSVFENVLINNLQPKLNNAMKYENARKLEFDETILEWKKYTGRRTRRMSEEEKIERLIQRIFSIPIEERKRRMEEKVRIRESKPKKENKPRERKYGTGGFSKFKSGKHTYWRYRIRKNGVMIGTTGKTKEEAYEKYLNSLDNNNS